MKHIIMILSAFLLVAASNVMADESFKHEYNNDGHYDGVTEPRDVLSQEKDPYTLATDSQGNIDFDALPPTAAGTVEPKAAPEKAQ